MKEAEMAAIADMISEVLLDLKNVEAIAKVRQRVRELTGAVPAALLSSRDRDGPGRARGGSRISL